MNYLFVKLRKVFNAYVLPRGINCSTSNENAVRPTYGRHVILRKRVRFAKIYFQFLLSVILYDIYFCNTKCSQVLFHFVSSFGDFKCSINLMIIIS